MKNITKFLMSFMMIFMIVFSSACTVVENNNQKINQNIINNSDNKNTNLDNKNNILDLEGTNDLKKISSQKELTEYLDSISKSNINEYSYYDELGGSFDMVMERSVMASDSISAPTSKSADSYSQTNIQVEGVDESDFIKNDGKYIYVLSQDNLIIVDAFPAEESKILSKTQIEGYPSEIFINQDRLVVFSRDNEEVYSIMPYDYMPRKRYTSVTYAYVYDISDRQNPILLKEYNVKGDFYKARMIGDYVYFISKEYLYYSNRYVDMPFLKDGSKIIMNPEIFYFDTIVDSSSFVFHTITSLNLKDEEKIDAKTFMLGYSNNLYVSENSIYITYQKQMDYRYYQNNNIERFYEAVIPILSSDVRKKIENIKNDDNIKVDEKWQEISIVLQDMYNSMSESEKKNLIKDIESALEKYDVEKEKDLRKTIIHKININKGNIEYDSWGEVNGYLLNQFSMDESGDYFRVATTTYTYSSRKRTMFNNVYVLDNNMEVIGKLEGLAEDERIYSARFMGEKLYMVTFKEVDPLFVIDLKDAKNPKVLGELKIPGYSDYLHPYDENHLIGIGKETEENSWGGVSVGGVKVSLFDVSDFNNPKELDSFAIGGPGSDSEALRDHRAVLFDKEKDIFVIPIREHKLIDESSSKRYYPSDVWQGAYVFSINPQTKITVKGKVTHTDSEVEDYYYWSSPYSVRRSLYMDDVLYTISSKRIVMNDLNDIDNEINSITLPYKQDKYYNPYYYG
jgi:inhibitor of cysteine peptidase